MVRIARRLPRTKLAARRQQIQLSQKRLSELSGVSLRTVQRLERGEVDNPPIRYLVNLAIVLDCRLVDICEDEWMEWTVFDASASEPPHPKHWLPARDQSER